MGNRGSFHVSSRETHDDESSTGEDEQVLVSSGRRFLRRKYDIHDVTITLLSLTRSGKLTDPDLLYLIFEYVGITAKRRLERKDRRRGSTNENRNDLVLSLFKERAEAEDTLLSLSICANYELVSVEYEVVSHDQGWSGEPQARGTRTSHTWGEAKVNLKRLGDANDDGQEKVDELPRYTIYRNLHASNEWETHRYTFEEGTAFIRTCKSALNEVRQQRAGDVSRLLRGGATCINYERNPSTILECSVQLWIRSQYPAWANHILRSQITTEWKMRKECLASIINKYSP